MKVVTNNVPREVVCICELKGRYRKQAERDLKWLGEVGSEEFEYASVVVYKGNVIATSEIERIPDRGMFPGE